MGTPTQSGVPRYHLSEETGACGRGKCGGDHGSQSSQGQRWLVQSEPGGGSSDRGQTVGLLVRAVLGGGSGGALPQGSRCGERWVGAQLQPEGSSPQVCMHRG